MLFPSWAYTASYLLLVAATGAYVYLHGARSHKDTQSLLLVSWLVANSIPLAFPSFWIPMALAHMFLALATLNVWLQFGCSAARWITIIYMAMMLNHFAPDVGSYWYHLRQNMLFAAQCLVNAGGVWFTLARYNNPWRARP